MPRILIFGNSGAGKTTLARQKAGEFSAAHLDLDSIAWRSDNEGPARKSLKESWCEIEKFLSQHQDWVIEGCYADLLEMVLPTASEVIFLNPGIEVCRENCKQRPWEAHKYATPEAQKRNLEMLLDWVGTYEVRSDEFSLQAHRRLFDLFQGKKAEYRCNFKAPCRD